MYGITDIGLSTFADGLVKYDAETHTTLRWSQQGQTPGEPIFVADPSSTEEDGGALLSVVLDGPNGKSYLLVLDAKTMKEIGRAHVDGVVGFGFHGVLVTEGSVSGHNSLDF
jgi:torulene dioxygenase